MEKTEFEKSDQTTDTELLSKQKSNIVGGYINLTEEITTVEHAKLVHALISKMAS